MNSERETTFKRIRRRPDDRNTEAKTDYLFDCILNLSYVTFIIGERKISI